MKTIEDDDVSVLFVDRLVLISLFLTTGVYGDVHRVKILFNKKDTALIQMAEPHQAQLGNFKIIVSDVTRH